MSRCGVSPLDRQAGLRRGERFGLARRAHHHRFAGLLRREAQRKPGRAEEAHQRDRERKHRHEHGRQHHDIAEAAQPHVDAQGLRARRPDRRDDLAALPVHPVVVVYFACYPLELVSSRVGRAEMTLHVAEQRWHLPE